jgi:hypothetical protein
MKAAAPRPRGSVSETGDGILRYLAISVVLLANVWHAPRWWLGRGGAHPTGAFCIHHYEGSWTSAGYYGGGMQFLVSTWNKAADLYPNDEIRRVSSTAEIGRLAPRVQLHAAYLVWDYDGPGHVLRDGRGSWTEWGTRGVCGLS